jgi:hypothetical protein
LRQAARDADSVLGHALGASFCGHLCAPPLSGLAATRSNVEFENVGDPLRRELDIPQPLALAGQQ